MRINRVGVFAAAFGLLLGLSGPVGSSVTQAEPESYIICTQGTADEGKDPIDHPIAAPWGPAAQALEPGDPLPEPDTDPDNIIEPPITNGMIVEGRGAGEGTTYKITIDPTCGLSPITPAPPSSPAEPAPSETAPPSGPAPSVLKPSFTG